LSRPQTEDSETAAASALPPIPGKISGFASCDEGILAMIWVDDDNPI
jgi:hypothetical protein